jgi:hypothetical protein
MLRVEETFSLPEKGPKKGTIMCGIFTFAVNAARKGLTKPVLLTLIWVSSVSFLNGQTFSQQTGNNLPATNSLTPVPVLGTLLIDYNFFTIPDSLDVYYDNSDIFSSGVVSGGGQFIVPYGPGLSSSITIVVNQDGNPFGPSDAWQYIPSIVPEPNTLALLFVGAISMLVYLRRRELRDDTNCTN